MRVEHPSHRIRETDKLLPQYILRTLSDVTDGNALVVTGVGQHQMWAAQHCRFKNPNSLITSGGLGAMGFEVPAAMGSKSGSTGQGGLVHRRGRRVPDDAVRPGYLCREQHRSEVRHHEQRVPGHGAPVAGLLLQQGLYSHKLLRQPGLCEAGRGLRYTRNTGNRQVPGGVVHTAGDDGAGTGGGGLPGGARGERLPDDSGGGEPLRDAGGSRTRCLPSKPVNEG